MDVRLWLLRRLALHDELHARDIQSTRRDVGGDDLFVHYSNIAAEGFKTLPEGADVTFRVADGRKGPEAFDVALA